MTVVAQQPAAVTDELDAAARRVEAFTRLAQAGLSYFLCAIAATVILSVIYGDALRSLATPKYIAALATGVALALIGSGLRFADARMRHKRAEAAQQDASSAGM